MSINRLIVAVAMAGALAANTAQAQSWQTPQQQVQAQQPLPRGQRPYAIYPLQKVFGKYGYFEVTPSGGLAVYPVWTEMDPDVMYTILAMMGATSLVGRRGYYEVTGGAGEHQVQFFLPPGSIPSAPYPPQPSQSFGTMPPRQ